MRVTRRLFQTKISIVEPAFKLPGARRMGISRPEIRSPAVACVAWKRPARNRVNCYRGIDLLRPTIFDTGRSYFSK